MQVPKHKIDNLRSKLRNFEKAGKEVAFDVTFMRGTEKDKIIEHATAKDVCQINKILKFEEYESLKIEIYDLKSAKPNKAFSTDFVHLKNTQAQNEQLGELEQNRFEKYIQEREKDKAFADMQTTLSGLEKENSEYEALIEEQQQHIEELEQQLKTKSNFKHYAGMIGEILGKIGIKSEKLNAVTGLLGLDDFQQIEEQPQALSQAYDTSGIVENPNESPEESPAQLNPQEQKKIELIQLMVDFLYNLELKTLGLVFAVFSEIEQQPDLAKQILLFINQIQDTSKPVNE